MARINSFLSQFVADEFSLNPPVWLNELRCLAGFTITTWHDIHAAMRTLPMAMNPNNIFRPPARWALWLQNWLWLGFRCRCCFIWYLLFYLGQLDHLALGWGGSESSDDSAKCRQMQDLTITLTRTPNSNPPCQNQGKCQSDLHTTRRIKTEIQHDGKKL